MCNIFGTDARRTADFAFQHGFVGIDWTPEPLEAEDTFLARMEELSGLEVRLHCAFRDADMASHGDEGKRALDLHRQWAERAAMAGIHQMTVQIGTAAGPADGSFRNAVASLKKLVQEAAGMGITVALKNLDSPFSGDPFVFSSLVVAAGLSLCLDLEGITALREQWPAVGCRDYTLPSRRQVHSLRIGPRSLRSPVLLEEIERLFVRSGRCWWVLDDPTPSGLLRLRDGMEERFARHQAPLSLELLLSPLVDSLQPA